MLQTTANSNLRFQIFNENMQVLFDTNSNENAGSRYTQTVDYAGTTYINKVTFNNLPANTTFYIKVYSVSSSLSALENRFTLSIGQPYLEFDEIEITVHSFSVVKNETYSFSTNINAPDTAYCASLYRSYSSYFDNFYRFRSPSDYAWKTAMQSTMQDWPFDYDSLVPIGGTWDFELTGARTGSCPATSFRIFYYYEL